MGQEFPIIDIGPFRTGSSEQQRAVGRMVDRACRESGFLLITGHGVPRDLIDRMHEVTRAFFDLPDQAKLAHRHSSRYLGYVGPDKEFTSRTLDIESPGEPKEAYSFQVLRPRDHDTSPNASPNASPDASITFEPDVWPGQPSDFRRIYTRYTQEMLRLAELMLRLCGSALALPMEFFQDKLAQPLCFVRAFNYPELSAEPLPGQLRTGPHTDYGALTMLSMDDAPGGLQVYRGHGRWENVTAPRDVFVVNIGDLMARWTNDIWVSSLHRVANPPREAAGTSRRQSIVFFHSPDENTMVVPFETCCTPERPVKYEPITIREHFLSKLSKQFKLKASPA